MRKTQKDKISSGLGSILEWYDFSLYGFFAPIFSMLYFPSDNASIATLKTFAVFAIGFMARPVGGLIFGYIGDKFGRAKCLKLTPLLITFPTLIFAILPTYEHIGLLAPIILIVVRVLQGICIGGEYASNIIYLCETARSKNLYFFGSLGSCAASLGILLASSIASFSYFIFTHQDLYSWGWRLPFALSILIGILAYWARRNISETPVYEESVARKRNLNPILSSWKNQWRDYLLALSITLLPATAFYFIFVFLPNYLSSLLDIKAEKILMDNSIILFLRLLMIPMLGFISDKVGGTKIAQLSSILFIVFSVPVLYGVINFYHSFYYSLYIFSLFTTLNAATTPGLLVELLRPETRCTTISFTLNISFGVLGGMVPFVGFLLFETFNNAAAPAYYLMFTGIITFVGLFLFKYREGAYDKRTELLTHID